MSEHFISITDAEGDLLSCATYLGERVNSVDGRAEVMWAVVPLYLARGNVDLAAELANTVDDPFTRDRLLIAVAEKCAEMDDDEYALQLAEAVEEPGLQAQAMERIGLQKAAKGQFDKALEIAGSMNHPDGVLVGVAVGQAAAGLDKSALEIVADGIQHPAAAVAAFVEIAANEMRNGNVERAVEFLEGSLGKAADIEHTEEMTRAYLDIGNGFLEADRKDRAVETFAKAKAAAETLDNMHRDAFLALTAQGFLQAGSVELADRTLDLVTDKTHIASCLLGHSRQFWKNGEHDDALESLDEAYAILESQHERETRDHKSRFKLFTSIAAQFAGFEKGERAIEIAEKIKDEGERTAALSQIAAVLTLRKADEEARHAFRSIHDDGDRVFALIGMSDAKEKNEDRTGAIELLDEAVVLAEAVPQLTMRTSAYIEIGKRFAGYGKTENAREAFAKAIETAIEIRDESARVALIANLAEVGRSSDVDLSASAEKILRTVLARSH